VVDFCAEIFERGFDTGFRYFEFAVFAEGSLLLNRDGWSLGHRFRASTDWWLEKITRR